MSTKAFRFTAVLVLGALAGWRALDRPLDLPNIASAALRGGPVCGVTYRVVRGDTLHGIATRAYGHGDYQTIFEANRRNLTSDARLNVGDELLIPCLDDSRPKIGPAEIATASLRRFGRAGADPTEPAISAAAIRPDLPPGGRVRFLTGSNFAPFVHAALPENGMTAEMVRLAMTSAAPGREVELSLVQDWSAHLDLLAEGGFDLGFPWYRPDCANADRLAPSMQRRCAEFDFSEPLFEVDIGYYVREGDPLAGATTYDRLSDRRICRPASHFTFDLAQEGLVRPNTALVFPPTPSDCFELLANGAVDVVTASKPLVEGAITQLGLAGRVVEIPALESRQTLHVIAAKAHPHGRAYLDLVNAGAADLRETGRWFEIAARHFGAFGVQLR